MAAAGIVAYISIFVLKGPIVYFMLFLGIITRPVVVVCFFFLTFKIAIISIANIFYRDWALITPSIAINRQLFLMDVSILAGLSLSQYLWYRI